MQPAQRVEMTPTAVSIALDRHEMETRRLLGGILLDRGMIQAHVARKLGVSRTTAHRWYETLAAQGMDALHRRKASGRPRRLTQEQEKMLVRDFAGDDKRPPTTVRFAVIILERFGVAYNPDHAGRIMHRLGIRKARLGGVRKNTPAAAD